MDKRLPNIEDRINLERLSGGDYFPDRNLVCYASSQSGGVILKDLIAGTERVIPAKAVGAPQFFPDGSAVLFLAAGDGGRQAPSVRPGSGCREAAHDLPRADPGACPLAGWNKGPLRQPACRRSTGSKGPPG